MYYHSPMGAIKVAGTADFISLVHFVKENEPVSPQGRPESLLVECVEQLIAYFSGALRQFNLPLHQEGTAFQQRVWAELITIPFGKTVSYLDMARRLGDLKSIRAAASANGKNNIAIIVPCHRVIGANGSLVGYAGGLARKKWLLDHEKKIAHGVQTLF